MAAAAASMALKYPQVMQMAASGGLPGLPAGLPGLPGAANAQIPPHIKMLYDLQAKKDAENLQNKALSMQQQVANAQTDTASSQKFSTKNITNLLKTAFPYITLFLVCFLLWYIFKKGSSVPAPMPKKRNVAKEGLFNSFFNQLNKIFSFSYETKKFLRMLSPLSGDVSSNDRPIIGSGRCNNMEWVETDGESRMGSEGEQGYCETTILPNDIKWKLDTARMPEYGELPKVVRDSIKNQLDIIIPWSHNEEASFYVPQCDKAVFAKTCDPKDPTNYAKCKRADLLEDNGMTCKLREQTSLMYKEGRRCNNSTNVGIIDPKNYRILTLIQRLQNKLNAAKKSDDMINVYIDNITGKDRAVSKQTNNVDLPISYPLSSFFSKFDPNYNKGLWNATLRTAIPAMIAEQEAKKTESAVTSTSTDKK